VADKPTVTKGPRKPPVRIDFELLTAEDKLRIQEEVLAQARDEQKAAALEAYRKVALEEARREEGLEEEMISFVLDLAEFADRLTIDGKIFFHGRHYTVPRSVYQVLTDMAFKTHQHQHEIDGKSMTRWRGFGGVAKTSVGPQSRGTVISPHGVVNTSHLARQ
jgi:hypothetical protein